MKIYIYILFFIIVLFISPKEVHAVQTARPTSDISTGSWTDEGITDNDGSLYTSVDEVTIDNDDSYINATSSATTSEVKLGSVTDPVSNTGHIVHVFGQGFGSGGPEKIDVFLYDNTTLIATAGSKWAPGRGSYLDLNYTLLGAEADNISDYANLRVRFTVDTLGGSETFRITQVYMEFPNEVVASPIFTQNDFEWFVTADSVTLSNIWPAGGGADIAENTVITPIPFGNEPLASAGQIRIQMNFTVAGATLAASSLGFKLWYEAADDCTTAASWIAVGATNAGTIWRLFDEASVGPSTAQVNNISTSTSSAEGYYSEINVSGSTPNEVLVTENSEWDWPVENNGAVDNTNYCFRMTIADDTAFDTYNSDSYPQLATAPGTADQMRHGNIFTGGNEQGFYWAD